MHARPHLLGLVTALVTAPLLAQPSPETPERLFQSGRFAEAKAALLSQTDDAAPRLIRLGEICVLENRLEEAETWLCRAAALDPAAKRPNELLAEMHYRAGRFADAATLYEKLGRKTKAAQLASFGAAKPYETSANWPRQRVAFVQTDPLPVIQVQFNDGEPVNCLIDTGAAEIVIDPGLAERLKAPRFGSETGMFAGAKSAPVEFSRVDSVTLGNLEVRNVPVKILKTRGFSNLLGRPIDAIIGTVFLYHFRSTLDYPGGALVLERLAEPSKPSASAITVPFWLAGDHYMVAAGTANRSKSLLWFIDTGLVGRGFLPTKATLDEIGVRLDPANARQGMGGGGPVSVIPFVVDHLTLGDLEKERVHAVFGAFPEPLAESFGFRIGGIVSHSFLRDHAVTFDFQKMHLVLAPPAE